MSDETKMQRDIRIPRAIERGSVLLGLLELTLALALSTRANGNKKSFSKCSFGVLVLGERRLSRRFGRTDQDPEPRSRCHTGEELFDYIKAGQIDPISVIYKDSGFKGVMPARLSWSRPRLRK